MKTYTYSYQNGPGLGASTDAGEFGRVPAPSSVRVGAYRIRPPNISQGMNDHTPGTCIRHRWWRPVGRMQYAPTHAADAPEASESVKQVVSRFPTRRKGSNKLFQGFRGLGRLKTRR